MSEIQDVDAEVELAITETAPETAPAAAASSGEVKLDEPVDVVKQEVPANPEPVMVVVKLKQDVILNGRMYAAGGTYAFPEDAWHIYKHAMVTEE